MSNLDQHQLSPAKSLSERIAEHIKCKQSVSVASRNRSAFISLRGEIEQAYRNGWSLLAIWRLLHEEQQINFTYQAFRRYFKKLINLSPGETSGKTPGDQSSRPKVQSTSAGAKSFSYQSKSSQQQS